MSDTNPAITVQQLILADTDQVISLEPKLKETLINYLHEQKARDKSNLDLDDRIASSLKQALGNSSEIITADWLLRKNIEGTIALDEELRQKLSLHRRDNDPEKQQFNGRV